MSKEVKHCFTLSFLYLHFLSCTLWFTLLFVFQEIMSQAKKVKVEESVMFCFILNFSVYVFEWSTPLNTHAILQMLYNRARRWARRNWKLRILRRWVIPTKTSKTVCQRLCETTPSISCIHTERWTVSPSPSSSHRPSLEESWGGTRSKASSGWGSVWLYGFH